tara:strand:- start:24017 stop:26119 length:2103 start_codon:yes stop_codon:yes gene_type:complete
MPELLLEILSEEIPARMQARAADDLKRLVTDGLKAAGLEFSSADAYVTPRRLALVVDGLPDKQPDVSEEKRGPNVNAPEQAINGFKGSLPEGAVIEERETPKGVFLFAMIDKKGEAAERVIIKVINNSLLDFDWPKSMRWASTVFRWVRPIHGILALFDGEPLNMSWGLGTRNLENPDAKSIAFDWSSTTLGHRFLAPGLIIVSDFADYKQKLLAAKVMLDPADRHAKIEADAKALCEAAGLSLKDDPGLLDEVTGLVEWPVVYMGQIDDDYMDLPDEVLSTSMRSHQKYFSTLDSDGKLANRFIVVANTETLDGGKQVIAGNERVLRARLSDAKFFWDQDRAVKLETRVDALKDRVFHAKLGNLFEKVARVEALAAEIAQHVDGADAATVKRAARLAKADLSTGMVGEFPELQGVMGRYYALNDGEDAAVADAVAEHYAPQGPNDTCPTAPVSVCVALADKIDTLVGFFAIDEKPTGSKDPYALRRAALGVIRLVLENGLRIPLLDVFTHAHGQLGTGDDPSVDLMTFFADRLKVHLREQGVRHDLIDAVMALGNEDDLVRLVARVHALQGFLGTDDGANLLTAYKRAANILRIEEKKEDKTYGGESSIDAAVEPEEHDLINAITTHGPKILSAISREDFKAAMALMAEFRAPVDAYFDKVTVNADDPDVRENRLKTLAHVRRTMDQVADFSKIEGGKA